MYNIPLTNIYSKGRNLYLFHRVNKELKIIKEQTFVPYYYEPSDTGIFRGYHGERLEKLTVKYPSYMAKKRSENSMESDIVYTKRFLIDKVNIEKTDIRWGMFDIEIQTEEFPDVNLANKLVSCITIYDNFTDEYRTFWLPDYDTEYHMITAFINYIKKIKPDLMLGWNVINFDYPYLCNRFIDFAKKISPIGEDSYYNRFPAGISIVDYMVWDKKVTMNKKKSYALDSRANEELRTELNKKVDFNTLDIGIKEKNINDVKKMVAMEKKNNYISLFNDIRIMSKCLWDDMDWNSHIIDQLVLQEAKEKGLVLPKKGSYETMEAQSDDEKFEGAFRIAFETGLFQNIGKYDLSGAYLYIITDLCLDSTNIVDTPSDNSLSVSITDRKTKEIRNTYEIKQNSEAILPSLAKKLIKEKIKYKELKKNTNPQDPSYKDIEGKYEAIKTIFLSAWGVMGNKGFRLYDTRIAGLITSCVRDLVHYVNDKLHEKGYKVIYIDTDSCFVDDKGENISELLNELIQQWSQERFNKSSSITFELEGHFESLFILARCHYVGNLQTGKGIKKEIKGIEAKRKDSTIFMAKFQTELIDKILNGDSREDCLKYINSKIKIIKDTPLMDIAFPCRISVDKEYKNRPIFIRALTYTKEILNFDKRPGDLYYWIYVNPFGIEERTAMRKVKGIKKEVIVKKKKDVLAFDEDNQDHVKDINWDLMIKRNIGNKVDNIFEAMHWELKKEREIDSKKGRQT